MLIEIFKLWLKWRKNWDEICNCCGKCCYTRKIGSGGEVIINYHDPCRHLDTETHLCRIYNERFKKCKYCGKIRLFTALFNPTLPEDCGYVKTFRIWRKGKESEK